MRIAMNDIQANHQMTLKDYLRVETNRGRGDCELGREFDVDRHTILNWKRLYKITTVRRAILHR